MFGIERETIRTSLNGQIADTDHPNCLGSKLTHPYFTTDFGEAQLELVTPPHKTIDASLRFLSKLHRYFYTCEKHELLWPLSMPPVLGDIRIADFGTSNCGKNKTLYREGLAYRYPIQMQMISGIHANYSFEKPETSEKMMGVIRNFLRYGWLLSYLFGASPFAHKSLFSKRPKGLKKLGDLYYAPYATSLRMSHFGYYSRIQNQLPISYNKLDQYISDIQKALNTPHPDYEGYGLNSNLLQIPGELYSRIRPKSSLHDNGKPLVGLAKSGIDYIEVRALDLNPYKPLGIGSDQLKFTEQFLNYCLNKPSPPLSREEVAALTANQNSVALQGRRPRLNLQTLKGPKSMHSLAKQLIEDIDSDLMPLIDNPDLTLSAKLLADLKKQDGDMIALGLKLAKEHKKTLGQISNTDDLKAKAKKSQTMHETLEAKDHFYLTGYEDLEHSTQFLIRTALEKNIGVEILDRPHNIIRLTQGTHSHIVQQATKTALDTYIAPLIMDNKALTKQLLKENNLKVPSGQTFHSIDEAKNFKLPKGKYVIKPNTANFGLGIAFVRNQTAYNKTIHSAFAHAPSIIVEEFIAGDEYRFLIIGEKIIGVLRREPANVVGDGIHTIRQLVTSKNLDPHSFKPPKEHIQLTHNEKAHLKKQRLSPTSIPRKGKKILLRENSNISTGGDPIDVTDTIHTYYKKIALKAVKILDVAVCGVDMLIINPEKKDTYAIIELNYNPTLSMHAYPYQGTPRDGATPLFSLLGFQT